MITKDDLKEGVAFWSISSSIESESYGDCEPNEPWPGKLRQSETGVWYISYFNEEENTVDIDSNATAFARADNLYYTKEEAKAAYLRSMLEHIDSRVQELSQLIAKLTGEL